ncbi:hypothetical protein VSDG_07716 [Cytospora chrysosperma]|uniref:Cytochrome P450 n=1 Tax=Cytospora chrysosperma TaxID=252740 RepID=A0A423VIX8_CYTCH|nr:hypothetical protein VSDG_07716 [Valsa sordida]
MSHPIPQPRGLPLIGNIFDVNPSNTWQSLQRLAARHGEIFQLTVLGRTAVFVAGAALAGELCDESRFRKYVGGPIVEIRTAVHDALFTAFDHEEAWGVAHRICAPVLLDGGVVGGWCGEVVGCVGEGIGKWTCGGGGFVKGGKDGDGIDGGDGVDGGSNGGDAGDSSGDGGVLLINELNRLNLEATTLTLFGKKLNCITASEDHPMIQGMEDATSEAMKRPTRPGFINRLFYGNKLRSATRVMREEYAADLVSHRRQNPTGRRDLLWALMEGKDPRTGKGLSESQVVDEIVSMPIGSSTAPCLVASAVYFLCRNPGCLDRARRELDEVLGPWKGVGDGDGGSGGRQITAQDLPRLEYMEGIIRESLRLSCPAPGFNIEPVPRHRPDGAVDTAPVLLGGGKYQVAHDQAMVVVLAGVNRDPAVFEDPLAFRPERMMGERLEALPDGVKKWFGNGKRECIGRKWAWQFSMVVTAMLVRECEFEMVDPEWELDGRQDGWFNLRPVGFWVRVRPRGAS